MPGAATCVLEGKLEAATDRVLLSSYTLLPDENRVVDAAHRRGRAEARQGACSFNAVVSGGVVALPPRDATTELTDPPYELVRLLGEIAAAADPGHSRAPSGSTSPSSICARCRCAICGSTPRPIRTSWTIQEFLRDAARAGQSSG